MSVCCECCVLSGRGLCGELITRPEESYRLWCVVVCDLETLWMRTPWPIGGSFRRKKIQHNEKFNYYCDIKNRHNYISTSCSIIPSSQHCHVMIWNITLVNSVASYYRPYRQETLLIRLETPKHHCGIMQTALPWRPLNILSVYTSLSFM